MPSRGTFPQRVESARFRVAPLGCGDDELGGRKSLCSAHFNGMQWKVINLISQIPFVEKQELFFEGVRRSSYYVFFCIQDYPPFPNQDLCSFGALLSRNSSSLIRCSTIGPRKHSKAHKCIVSFVDALKLCRGLFGIASITLQRGDERY